MGVGQQHQRRKVAAVGYLEGGGASMLTLHLPRVVVASMLTLHLPRGVLRWEDWDSVEEANLTRLV